MFHLRCACAVPPDRLCSEISFFIGCASAWLRNCTLTEINVCSVYNFPRGNTVRGQQRCTWVNTGVYVCSTVSTTTKTLGPVPRPSGLNVLSATDTDLFITWTPVSDPTVDGYRITVQKVSSSYSSQQVLRITYDSVCCRFDLVCFRFDYVCCRLDHVCCRFHPVCCK